VKASNRVRLLNVRIDDRLLHGQVVYNWLRQLEPAWVMMISSDENKLHRDLLRAILPARYYLWLGTCEELVRCLSRSDGDPVSALLVLSDVKQVNDLVRARIPLPSITLGALGWRPGRSRFASQVSLDPAEVSVLASMAANGLDIIYQALPGDAAVPWAKFMPATASL
jgi:mannose/fructose/N-acetylgalactosamine-specific phosphotransferase system component IIB